MHSASIFSSSPHLQCNGMLNLDNFYFFFPWATSLYGVWPGSRMAVFECSDLDITGVFKFLFPNSSL
jgi:hypothetical protein